MPFLKSCSGPVRQTTDRFIVKHKQPPRLEPCMAPLRKTRSPQSIAGSLDRPRNRGARLVFPFSAVSSQYSSGCGRALTGRSSLPR